MSRAKRPDESCVTPRPCSHWRAGRRATLTAVPRNCYCRRAARRRKNTRSPMPFNVPILLTWLRVALIPVFVVLFYWPDPTLHLPVRNGLAALIFALAAITDWLDGYLARKWGQTSSFGAFLDPVADKLIVAAALILLVELERTQAWLAMVIIGREITISALREWMAQIGERRSVAVAYIGKLKTAAQMLAILLLLYWQPLWPGFDTPLYGNILMVIAAILTLWSMVYYLQMASAQLRGEKKLQ